MAADGIYISAFRYGDHKLIAYFDICEIDHLCVSSTFSINPHSALIGITPDKAQVFVSRDTVIPGPDAFHDRIFDRKVRRRDP